jgi:hypothetical protein
VQLYSAFPCFNDVELRPLVEEMLANKVHNPAVRAWDRMKKELACAEEIILVRIVVCLSALCICSQ